MQKVPFLFCNSVLGDKSFEDCIARHKRAQCKYVQTRQRWKKLTFQIIVGQNFSDVVGIFLVFLVDVVVVVSVVVGIVVHVDVRTQRRRDQPIG